MRFGELGPMRVRRHRFSVGCYERRARPCDVTREGCLMTTSTTPNRDGDGFAHNLTARAARWSAAHRRTAVLGWFAFVLVTFAIGSAAGVVTLKDDEVGIGDSHGAEAVLAREFPTERAAEQVL